MMFLYKVVPQFIMPEQMSVSSGITKDQKSLAGYLAWTHNHPKLQYPYMPNQEATQVKGTCFHVRAGLYT